MFENIASVGYCCNTLETHKPYRILKLLENIKSSWGAFNNHIASLVIARTIEGALTGHIKSLEIVEHAMTSHINSLNLVLLTNINHTSSLVTFTIHIYIYIYIFEYLYG